MQKDTLRDFLKFFRFHLPWFVLSAGFFAVILLTGAYFSTRLGSNISQDESKPLQNLGLSDTLPALPRFENNLSLDSTESSKTQIVELETSTASLSAEVQEIHTVQVGETLWSIAQQFYQDGSYYSLIAQANGLQNANFIMVGQELLLPPASSSENSGIVITKGGLINSGVLGSGVSIDRELAEELVDYTVVKGDCLWNIALQELGDPYRWVEIYQMNKAVIGNDPDLIYPDTILKVPVQ